jgi:hypothetical protein
MTCCPSSRNDSKFGSSGISAGSRIQRGSWAKLMELLTDSKRRCCDVPRAMSANAQKASPDGRKMGCLYSTAMREVGQERHDPQRDAVKRLDLPVAAGTRDKEK